MSLEGESHKSFTRLRCSQTAAPHSAILGAERGGKVACGPEGSQKDNFVLLQKLPSRLAHLEGKVFMENNSSCFKPFQYIFPCPQFYLYYNSAQLLSLVGGGLASLPMKKRSHSCPFSECLLLCQCKANPWLGQRKSHAGFRMLQYIQVPYILDFRMSHIQVPCWLQDVAKGL